MVSGDTLNGYQRLSLGVASAAAAVKGLRQLCGLLRKPLTASSLRLEVS